MSVGRVALLAAAALSLGGCSYQLGGVFGDRDKDPQVTHSIPAVPVASVDAAPLPEPASGRSATSFAPASGGEGAPAGLSGSDWLYARGALGLALTGAQDGPPVPWANPETGMRGTFLPTGEPEIKDGLTCRAFRATRIGKEAASESEGVACRAPSGLWDVAEVRPLQSKAAM